MKILSSVFLLPFFLASTTDAFQPAGAARRTTALSITMPDYNDGTVYAMENTDINNIIKQNGDYVKAMGQAFFDDLGAKHEPKYMWIGCADARAPANELMGEKPGSVFVVRNVANMVIATDVNLKSALQYGVNYLGIKHIIVCGHYECGGVRASMNNADVGAPLSMWLSHLRDVYRTHQKELNAIADPEARHRRMVEINAIEQCVNLFKTSVVQKQRVETAKDPTCKFPAPRIHACVFDPKDGSLKQLEINWEEYLEDLRDVYELYANSYVDEMSVPVHIPEMPTKDDPKRENKIQSLKNFFGIGE